MGIDRPAFVGDGEVAEMTAAPETVPRDEDGRVFRADWSDGPKPPPPDPSLEVSSAYLTKEEGGAQLAEINAEHETSASPDVVTSFDELDSNSQTLFRDQAGYDQAQASVDTIRANMGDAFAEMDAEFEELPSDAQMVVAALLSRDWKPHGAEALGDALDQLMDTLPLTSDAKLREFLVDFGFIEG